MSKQNIIVLNGENLKLMNTILEVMGKPIKKLVVLFLVFIFFIAPLSPVLADVIDTAPVTEIADTLTTNPASVLYASTTDPVPQTTLPTTDVASQDILSDAAPVLSEVEGSDSVSSAKDKKSKTTTATSSSSVQNSNQSIGANSSSPIKQIIPEPDPTTGALTYSYPIALPPGRNGMQPDVKLQYNSQDTTQDSILGFGWSLNIPYIVRVNKKGSNTLFTDNYFSSSLSGELVNISGSSYASKIENGDFLQYTYASNTWTATDKSGAMYTFGSQSSSRQDNPGDSSQIYKWMLEKVQDTNGNIITYTYTKDQNKLYPLNIHYAIFDVDFVKEARIDAMTSNAAGFPVTANYRISQIQIKVSGTTRTQYVFSYTTGDNAKKSLLQSIVETGYDANGAATVLPATTFEYTKHQGDIFNVAASQPVNGLSGVAPTSKGILTGDVNSDGYQDIVKAYEWNEGYYAVDKRIYVFNPATNSFQLSTTYQVPAGIMNYSDNSYTPSDGGTRILDIDGDGKNDLMRTPYNYSPSAIIDKEINNGSGFTQIPNTDPKYSVDYVSNPAYTLFSNDVNGDGLVDYIQDSGAYWKTPEGQLWYNTKTSLNNGSGFNYYSTQNNHGGSGTQSYAYTPLYTGNNQQLMFDINGDDLPDIIEATGNFGGPSVQKVYINNGNFWQFDTSYVLPLNFFYYYNGSYGSSNANVQIADFNQDGLNDILTLGSALYINQGKSFMESPLSNDMMSVMGNGALNFGSLMMDVNADGALDFIILGNPYAYLDTIANRMDVLKSVTLPAGGKVDISYKPSTQYKDVGGNLLNPNLPFIVQTVNTITTTDLVNNISSKDTYVYANSFYYFDSSNPFTRKFAGFGVITKTDVVGNTTKTYFHQGNPSASSGQALLGEYNDEYWKIGKAYRSEIANSSGNIYQKTINKWDSYDLGGSRKFVKLDQTISSTYDGDATHKDTAESYIYDNTNGNVNEKIQYGEVSGNDDGTFSDTGSDKLVTDYAHATGGSIVALPSQVIINNQSGTKIKESKFYYDGLAWGGVSKGNLTRQEDWKSDTSYINTQKSYDSYGLVLTSTDPRGNITQYTYDVYNIYPTTITNALGQSLQYVYDYSSGQPTQKTDANGRVFQYAYDGLGRLVQEKQPYIASPSTLVTKTTTTYIDTSNAVSVKKSSYLDDANVVDSYTYFDGLGRKIQELQEAEGGNFSTKDYSYNNLGLLQKESLPYFSAGAAKTSPISDTNLYVNYTYDSVGRVIITTNAIGTTTNTYNDWKLTTTDQNGKQKDFVKDAFGNLMQVGEHNGATIYTTNYSYDGLGDLLTIADASGNVRSFTYDALARKLTAQDLHFPSDTMFGTYSYSYDDAGNLTQITNPKSQITNYAYDVLNRQLSEDFTGQAGVEVTYAYDSGVDGKGRLTSVQNANVTQNSIYNALGLLALESKVIGANTHITSYDYDRQGNQMLITNPDNSQIKNVYNGVGLLEIVQRKESIDTGFMNVVNNLDYSPTGQITTQSDANGQSTINTYDATKLYRLTSKVTVAPVGQIQNLSYSYDAVGNIIQMIDASATATSKTANYAYDDLYRLTSATISNVATGQSAYTQSYTYDAVGNILTKTETIGTNPAVLSTYTYAGNTGANYANPHAVTSINDGTNTTSYTYDNNGNMTLDALSAGSGQAAKSYTFDYNNRLTQSSIPGSTPPAPTTTTFYPQTGDGSIDYNSTLWSATHDAARGSSANYINTTFNVNSGKYTSTNYKIGRVFLPFNTSSLPDNAVITSAKLKVYVSSKLNNDNDGDDWVSVAQGLQASALSLTTSDYNKAGTVNNPTEGIDTAERKDITNVATGQYLVFNLNTTGKSWISKTGSTKLALREGHDVINSPFTGSSGQYNRLTLRSSEYSGTNNDPILEVTYTTSAPEPPPTTITYAYDPSGQRIKLASPTATIYYPTKFYNIDSNTQNPTPITKHIFAGAQDIATIQGSGATAKIYYNSTDLLNSSSIMTDSSGAIAETMDYFLFGGIRIDNKVGTFSEQRKYIGQEYDTDTGLNYLNARYYNATIARFISEDPMFWNFDQAWLADPQNQNSYAYARNNPIVGSDPTGLTVYAVAKGLDAQSMATHTFLVLVPDNPGDFGLKNKGDFAVLGAYANPQDNASLMKAVNAKSDLDTYQTGHLEKSKVEVNRPNGVTDTQFINNIMANFNAYADDAQYDPFVNKGYNSNNFTTSLLVNSGVTQLPWNGNAPGIDPGYGKVIPKDYIKSNGVSLVPQGKAGALSGVGSYGSRETGNWAGEKLNSLYVGAKNTVQGLYQKLTSKK